MTFIEVVILAVVQGVTEFLPVSSSGHLVIARTLFGVSNVEGTAFDVFLHLGTLAAVLVFYWTLWLKLLKALWQKGEEATRDRRLIVALVVATVPAAIIGYLFEDKVVQFQTPAWLAVSFLLTAAALWLCDKLPIPDDKKEISKKDALIIGLAQVVALLPAVSRSGMTIAAGRLRGLGREQAINFSFLLSAPIIAGAGLVALPALVQGHEFPISQLIIGFIVSFVTGLAAIALLLRLVKRASFRPFVAYLVGLAVAILLARVI